MDRLILFWQGGARGAAHLLAAWIATALLCIAPVTAGRDLELSSTTRTITQYEKIEFGLTGAGDYSNPFDSEEVEASLVIASPSGRQFEVPAFWHQPFERRKVGGRDWLYPVGMPQWKIRFAPGEMGTYQASAKVKDRTGVSQSAPVQFECVTGTRKGFVQVSRRDPRFLELTDGSPFFPIGQNLAFIGSQQYVTLSKAEEIFAQLAANGANYLRIWACCEDWAMAIEARKSAWGRSWDWRPPIVPLPEGESTNRRGLKLTADKPALTVNPSHPVALRPKTRYAISGRILTEGDGVVHLEAHRQQVREAFRSPGEGVWMAFRQPFETGAEDYWLQGINFRLEGSGMALLADLSLKEGDAAPELLWEADVNRPVRGFYNPIDCFLLDELLIAAEQRGIYLQPCLITRDLYMSSLKDPASADYARAIADAQKLFRYAVARWGYSTSLAAWEYWNEMDPGLPTDRFYTALGEYLEAIDPYRHLRTTSTWGPSSKDCRHPKLDVADVHFYLRPVDKGRLRDEVDAVLERTRWLREQAPDKPAHLGEFGLANDKWQITDEMKKNPELADVHNALWASALSGASGTAMAWWWERLDQRNVYPLYRPLSAFLADVPWTSGHITNLQARASDPTVRVVGLQAEGQGWFWVFHPDAAWAERVAAKATARLVEDLSVTITNLPPGSYRVEWWDTRSGRIVRQENATSEGDGLHLAAPAFARDIACRIQH